MEVHRFKLLKIIHELQPEYIKEIVIYVAINAANSKFKVGCAGEEPLINEVIIVTF